MPGCAKERVLMLYFNTNVGATLIRGKGGGWCWLWGCLGPCEGAGREPCGPSKGIRQIGAILHAKRSVSDER